jgi:hypothetical protein
MIGRADYLRDPLDPGGSAESYAKPDIRRLVQPLIYFCCCLLFLQMKTQDLARVMVTVR